MDGHGNIIAVAVFPNPDATGEERIDARVAKAAKEVGIFEKELPPLRKEDLKPVEVDDLPIYFNLGKVGVEREV